MKKFFHIVVMALALLPLATSCAGGGYHRYHHSHGYGYGVAIPFVFGSFVTSQSYSYSSYGCSPVFVCEQPPVIVQRPPPMVIEQPGHWENVVVYQPVISSVRHPVYGEYQVGGRVVRYVKEERTELLLTYKQVTKKIWVK